MAELNEQFYKDWLSIYSERESNPELLAKVEESLLNTRFYKKSGKPLPSNFKTQLTLSSNLTQTEGEDFAIQIKYLNSNQPHTLPNILLTTSIVELKEKIHDLLSLSVDQQRLVFKGKPLMDSKTVKDYNITPGSVIHLLKKAGIASTSTEQTSPTQVKAELPSAPAPQPKLSSATIEKLNTQEFWDQLGDQLKILLSSQTDEELLATDITLLIKKFRKTV
ncbi:hypothetical protein CONCODRAFT_78602 [Conidiobolus coronatus NRRL 28638]|uniref:Ubiquitin-like domain-containing protein n=1 Tax=Conidiobolus coronatus (strain ATCC 28846 / CBS 209.66 / NRRL 28638) TaxID=796925 RepID=A0A137P7J8_CONC2|nr:hypothetical protein CONCODRAFT_78602 [Conidiobolus coronatus NRRL 28638]|eukprot:KXN70914.1 hypothetical protein CONCODRAFT_78602 [Conidiobolus coronatus NRRL 28638]